MRIYILFCICVFLLLLLIRYKPQNVNYTSIVPNKPKFETYFVTMLTNCQADIFELNEFNMIEPTVGATVEPPPVKEPNCEDYPKTFESGVREDKKVAILLQFGFDVDVLEIALYEYYDIVDYIFIAEATRTHRKGMLKPLMVNRLLGTDRFRKFADKVVPLVMDESNTKGDNGMWFQESSQEFYRFRQFHIWNKRNQVFGPDDIVGMGDVDEIASRNTINTVKRCVWKDLDQGIDVGIWFPMGSLDYKFRTDFPVSHSHPFTLGDPTFYKVGHTQHVLDMGKSLTRGRGTSKHFVLGGMHLSDHNYLPFRLLKDLTCTECGGFSAKFCLSMLQTYKRGGIKAVQDYYQDRGRLKRPTRFQKRSLRDNLYIPWFLEENHYRFPYMFDRVDYRLTI
jgi:hypothetical protein